MKKKIYFVSYFLILWIIGIGNVWSQSQILPNLIPPSPVSAGLQKFTGYPVSPGTGLVDVSIPLGEFNYYGMNFPLELKYHSSGVRVQDPVGMVAYGWSLFPGFKITRTVMGKPDEKYPVTDIGINPTVERQIFISSNPSNSQCTEGPGIPREKIDGQYDIFNIHLPGIEGAFILKYQNGNYTVQSIPDSPCKITPLFHWGTTNNPAWQIYGFEIADDKGIRYLFGDASYQTSPNSSYTEYTQNTSDQCAVGWMLREIIFPRSGSVEQKKVTFTYKKDLEKYPNYNQYITIVDKENPVGIAGCSTSYYGNEIIRSSGVGYDTSTSNTPHELNVSYISFRPLTIKTPDGQIAFTYTTDNQIATMVFTNPAGLQIKNVRYTYSEPHKLLSKLFITGEGTYQFSYNNEADANITNPIKYHFDWWGYCNGINRSSTTTGNLPRMEIDVVATRGSLSFPMIITIGQGANREPREAYMSARALKEVKYPTGGTFKINYEPHKFTLQTRSRTGGGLRVKSTELYDPVTMKTVTRKYTYEEANFTGKYYPDQQTLITTSILCLQTAKSCRARQRVLSVFPTHSYFNSGQLPVWYGKVTETTTEGKTIYTYQFTPDVHNNAITQFDYSSYHHSEYLLSRINRLLYPAPRLLTQTDYKYENGVYEKVQTTRNTYAGNTSEIRGTIAVPVYKSTSNSSHCSFLDRAPCGSYRWYDYFGSPIHYNNYYIATGISYLYKTEVCNYQAGDSIRQTTTWTRDTARPYNISKQTVSTSTGDEITTEYYYSNHTLPDKSTLSTSEQSAIATLETYNYKTTVLEQITRKNGQLLSSVLTGYKNLATHLARPSAIYTRKGSGNFEKRLEYLQYDPYGNPAHIQQDGAINRVYLWGYEGLYPVAAIENLTYSQVSTALTATAINTNTAASTPAAAYMTSIANIRITYPDSKVATYQYRPRVGTTQANDWRDIRQYFHYDTQQRLSGITRYINGLDRTIEAYTYNLVNP